MIVLAVHEDLDHQRVGERHRSELHQRPRASAVGKSSGLEGDAKSLGERINLTFRRTAGLGEQPTSQLPPRAGTCTPHPPGQE